MVEILSDAVRVTARLAPEGASQREFGIALYLHRVDTLQDDRADASFIRDVRQYATAAAVSADNAPDEVVEAARIYFQQSPFPRNLQTGTVIAAVQPSYIFGAGQRSVTAIEALGNGVALSLNGNDFTANFDTLTSLAAIATALQTGIRSAGGQASRLTGIGNRVIGTIAGLGDNVSLTLDGNAFTADFDGLTTLATIAAALQTGIRTVAAYSAATVTVVNNGFVITGASTYGFGAGFTVSAATGTLGLTGAGVIVTANQGSPYGAVTVAANDGALEVTGASDVSFGSGFAESDATGALGLTGAGALTLANIETAETPDDALDRIVNVDNAFFWVALAPEIIQVPADLIAVRTWVAARGFDNGAIFDLYGEGVLVSGETASLGAQLSALGGNGIAAIWNGRSFDAVDQKGLSYMARFSPINFNAPNAVPNGKFLQLPGTAPTSLSAAEKAELRRKRINYYLPVGSGTGGDTEEGQTFATWIDTFAYIAWFKSALQVAGYNYLKASSPLGGVPITEQGLAGVSDAIEEVCELAVRNGMLAPNFVSPAFRAAIQRATGNPDFDGFLSSGYLVVRPSAAQIDQAVRNARGPIPVLLFGKGAGRINNLDIGVDFEQ